MNHNPTAMIEKRMLDLYLRYCLPRIVVKADIGEYIDSYYEWVDREAEQMYNYLSSQLQKYWIEQMKREAMRHGYIQRI